MVHTMRFRPRTVLLGLRQYRSLFGVISPKTLPKGAWLGNFKPNRPNIKIAISCKA